MTILREANVYYGETLAGTVQETDEGYVFTYAASYLAEPGAKPISLTLPLQSASYRNDRLFPFFDGLIPEGWLLEAVCNNWKLDRRDRMGLLKVACNDCIGNISIRKDATHE